MNQDPRYRNELYNTSSVGNYLSEYALRLKSALESVSPESLERACSLLEEAALRKNRIYAVGNGGSAAIADHLCCDLTKGTYVEDHPTLDTISLCSNVALYSAVANDFGFNNVFSVPIGFLGRTGDVLLAISSSGNSPNIVAAVEAARAKGMASVGLTGFQGGRLRQTVDVSIHVEAENYGVVEDAHQAVMHVLAQFIATRRELPTS